MLRNRSRAVSSKQAFMADHTSLFSPTKNPSSPISSFLGSPRFFNGFLAKSLSDAETSVMSPTSILDTKNSSSFVNPFAYETLLSKPPTPSPETNNSTNKPEPQAMGLALIDSIIQENDDDGNCRNLSKPVNRMVLFGSKLKVQIPAINPQSSLSPAESPKSPADFGIKTRNSQVLSPLTGNSPAKDFSRQLSLKEMELSEEYTCVISHGPNPRTTHIFDGCIVESCCGDDAKESDHNKNRGLTSFETDVSTSPSANFLSFCHNCKDILGQGKDIYMYRGEKAFCSHECRCQEILFEGMKNQELEDAF
ncbi:FCS-Like Zinc finger 8 [Sesamum angolense]|uniref:FCS-Like Zinc finger 8 n=1 Tax=Sesamum angolense TaxID=2727404 RepID=A0AAE1X8B6_9LAMI|nr:FCS-Like Zinc finger 8 [Sesamum angolense]